MKMNSNFSNTSAMATTTFAWIFMTIVGGVLIMFTYSIVQGYWEVEEQSNRLEFSKALTNSLNVIARNALVNNAINSDTFPLLSQKEAYLVCIESEFTRLNLDGREIAYEPLNTYLDTYPVFMPPLNEEEPGDLFIVIEEFNFPMSIIPLVGIIPTHHIVIINQTSVMSNIVKRVEEDQSVYSQFSIFYYDSSNDFDIYLDEIENYNPSSITFVDFNSSRIPTIHSRFYQKDFDVYAINVEFVSGLLPSYIQPSNDDGAVLGTLKYVYSNKEENFKITDQTSSPKNPKNFRFVGLDDDLSLVLFSFFSSPSNFDCAFNSLEKAAKLRFEYIQNKIEIIQLDETVLNTTYCDGSKLSSPVLASYYSFIDQSFEDLYLDDEHNFLNYSTSSPIQIAIDIKEENAELRQQSCELVY